jgi:small subunit ribosomal protein S20
MANHPSAERRNRQRIRKTARNRSVKSAVRTGVKNARAAVGATERAEVEALVRKVESELDKAAQKGVLHPRAASRRKARLKRAVHAASKGAA